MIAVAPTRPTTEQLWNWLCAIPDPEIPVISIVDLGIVRSIAWNDAEGLCVVRVTPTYSACPAFAVIQQSIREAFEQHGLQVRIEVHLAPPWTTDWLSTEGAQKLRAIGIAPPARTTRQPSPLIQIEPATAPHCPHCGSPRTTLVSEFSSTLCKSLYRCDDCREPFDLFKSH